MNKPLGSSLCLVDRGIPQVAVVASSRASAPEEYAAEELRRHLHAMAGTSPCLRNRAESRGPGSAPAIYVNDRAAAKRAGLDVDALALGPESFHLRTVGRDLHILGGGPRGVLYGVYELLETLGCRWFAPEVERIPRRRRIDLPPTRQTGGPAFEFRDMWVWDGSDPVWWTRNRMNGWYTPVPGYIGGHIDYGLFVHTFYTLLPPERFFGRHPEYFSLVNGARRRDRAQLCLTNPQVLDLVVRRLREVVREKPKARIFSVSQNDCAGYCECPRCAAVAQEEGSQSGPILRFVNAVAERTSRRHPDLLIDTLAYWYSLDAPRRAVPHPNVRVRLCSIQCCQGHGYGTCRHPESARFLRALKGWSRITPQMYIWHYCTNFANYPLPMPDFDEIEANLRLYRRFGVYGVFMQGMGEEGGGGESMALRGYVISKLLWNPDQPVWPLVDEFLAGYYGPAAPAVRRYLDLFHRAVRRDRNLHPSLYDLPRHPLFRESRLAAAAAALLRGEALARGAERKRARLLRHGLTYARLWRRGGCFRLEGNRYRGLATPADRRALEAMVRDWREAGIVRLRENVPFDQSVNLLRSRLAEHEVEWLRDGEQSLALAPALGGRVLAWRAFGRQWLAPADPADAWQHYPMNGGYVEFALEGVHHYHGGAAKFRCRLRGRSAVLTGDIEGRLRLRRTLSLRGGALHIASHLENRAATPLTLAWGAGLHLSAGAGVTVAFDSEAGARSLEWTALPDGLDKAMAFEGKRVPGGEWRVDFPRHRLTHRFSGVARAIIGKKEALGVLALDLRSSSVALAPGEAITCIQTLCLRTTWDTPERNPR